MVDRQGGELLLPDGKLSLLLPLVFATFTAAAYAWTAGFSAPTQRAIVMCVVGAICLFGGRKVPPLTILLLVLSISLAIDLWVYSMPDSGFPISPWWCFLSSTSMLWQKIPETGDPD